MRFDGEYHARNRVGQQETFVASDAVKKSYNAENTCAIAVPIPALAFTALSSMRVLSDIFYMTQYTAAIVGTGRIGFTLGFDRKREQPASHTMALLADRRIRVVAGCDSDATRLTDWKRYVDKRQHTASGVQTFTTSKALYAAMGATLPVPDIITVAVNENAHRTECIAAIRARPRLVILEKPVALNSAEAAEIADAARENDVPVLVNHERRFSADYRAARAYLAHIGTVQHVRAELYSGLRVYSAREEHTGAYSLLHDGTHLVDIVQFLLAALTAQADAAENGEVPLLSSPTITGIWRDEQGDVRNFSAHYHTVACPEVTISMSGRSRFFAFGVDVLGTEGRICIGNGYAQWYRRAESKLYSGFYSLTRDRSVRLPRKTGYFAGMIRNAISFLDGTSTLESPLAVAIADLAVLEELKASLQRKP